MHPDEILSKSVEISHIYDSIATRIFERAKLLRKEHEIDYMEYKQIMDNYYLPLMNYSSKILMDTANTIIDNMDEYIVQIEDSSNQLMEVSEKLQNSQQIFKGITFVLASAAALATFIAAPSKTTFSAAFGSISGAVKSISKITESEA